MTGKGAGGKKSKYMYYTCEKCKIYFNEDDVEGNLIDYILDFIEYDYHVNKFFYLLLAEKKDDEAIEIEKEIKKYEDQKKRLIKVYKDGILEMEDFADLDGKMYKEMLLNLWVLKSKEEKQDFISRFIESIALKKNEDNTLSIEKINFRSTFIEQVSSKST